MNRHELDTTLKAILKATREINKIADAFTTLGLDTVTDKLNEATQTIFNNTVDLEATKETVTELEELKRKNDKEKYDFDDDIPF